MRANERSERPTAPLKTRLSWLETDPLYILHYIVVDFSESVTGSINYYRAAFQYPELGKATEKNVSVPVLSIFGTGDKYLSVESARGTKRYVENLTEKYIDGVGHWVQMEDAKSVNQSMKDYLSSIN